MSHIIQVAIYLNSIHFAIYHKPLSKGAYCKCCKFKLKSKLYDNLQKVEDSFWKEIKKLREEQV